MSTPAQRLEIINRVDPVHPSSGLRRSEMLACRRRDTTRLASEVRRLAATARHVHSADSDAFLQLLGVAAKAIESADNIIDFAAVEIAREVARAEFALGKSAL